MNAQSQLLPPDLVRHLTQVSGLPADQAERLVTEMLAYYAESAEVFIRRRHLELQTQGLSNAVIFQQIAAELPYRRFPSGTVSERQIRRIIYG